jgi:hypothetical protein
MTVVVGELQQGILKDGVVDRRTWPIRRRGLKMRFFGLLCVLRLVSLQSQSILCRTVTLR